MRKGVAEVEDASPTNAYPISNLSPENEEVFVLVALLPLTREQSGGFPGRTTTVAEGSPAHPPPASPPS